MIQRCYNGVRYLDGLGPSLENVEKLDMGALPMIHHMQKTGLMIDPDHFRNMDKLLTEDMDRITEQVKQSTGYTINLGSGDQVSDLLFNKLGLKQLKPKMTDSGDRESVAYEVLIAVQHQHPVVAQCIEYKEVEKLRGTYARPIPKLAKRTKFGEWRLYPNFGTTRIPSGRLNCKEPNLLAMPNKTKRAKQLCRGFITRPGWVFLSVDESQIEPRVVAHRSGDAELTRIYQNREDIYSDFAITAFQIPDKRFNHSIHQLCPDSSECRNGWHYPGVDKTEHRFPSKTCVLASIYEVSGPGLREQMPVVCKYCKTESKIHNPNCLTFESLWNDDNCQDMVNNFGIKYEGVIRMRAKDHRRARTHGLAWDDWGRILHAQQVYSVHEWVVSSGLREIGNFPIQGTAQGTVKLAMAKIMDELAMWGLLGEIYNPLLQIHDEILGEVREDYAQEVGMYIKDVFENIVRLNVPIVAEFGTSLTWGDMKK